MPEGADGARNISVVGWHVPACLKLSTWHSECLVSKDRMVFTGVHLCVCVTSAWGEAIDNYKLATVLCCQINILSVIK